jgi:hypothetical protein
MRVIWCRKDVSNISRTYSPGSYSPDYFYLEKSMTGGQYIDASEINKVDFLDQECFD